MDSVDCDFDLAVWLVVDSSHWLIHTHTANLSHNNIGILANNWQKTTRIADQ